MEEVHKELLSSLKTIVEGLLSCQVANVWNVYGGLNRLHTILERILKHDFKIFKDDTLQEADCWKLIEGLQWLAPSLASSPTPVSASSPPPHHHTDPPMVWLHNSLETHSLSEKLSWLLSDSQHLSSCYLDTAFLRQHHYAEATLVCLKAVEQNRLSLLSDIPPHLYCRRRPGKMHRRCSSLPETLEPERVTWKSGVYVGGRLEVWREVKSPTRGCERREGAWGSLPVLSQEPDSPDLGTPTTTIQVKGGKTNKRGVPPTSDSSLESTTSYRTRVKRKSFIEDGGGRSVLPMRTGYFPTPRRGQSLISFLRSRVFASAELDRENAHFLVSEAIIAAVEQVKWEVTVEEESDDEIQELKKRLKERRRRRHAEKANWPDSPSQSHSDSGGCEGEGSPSPNTSASGGSTESLSTDVDAAPHNQCVQVTGEHREQITSAEGVALSLLSKFSNKILPKASEIVWLVSEKDAPQQLLPLPESMTACAPDEDMKDATELRGTPLWAPPRPQVIFTVHPPHRRAALMGKQKFRCAGCGMKVAEEYMGRLRYCEYLGRYFCTGCHSATTAIIPGRVLAKWDFTKYPVSNFSGKLLEGMQYDPLFCPTDVNPVLYSKVKPLERTKVLRVRLSYLREFLIVCRLATNVTAELEKEANYIFQEADIYSMEDLVQVKSGKLLERLGRLVSLCVKHVATCQLCEARGFICETCRSPQIIYPWELGHVERCGKCGSCRHVTCATSPCLRCKRLASRAVQQSRLVHIPT